MKKQILCLLCALLLPLIGACAPTDGPESPESGSADMSEAMPAALPMEYDDITSASGFDSVFYSNNLDRKGADPTFIIAEENGRTCYYMYVTGIRGYYSYNLMGWIEIPDAFPKPQNSWSASSYWAPEIIYDKEAKLYRLFYSAQPGDDDMAYLSMAVSESPRGPFVQWTGTNADGLVIDKKTPLIDFARMDPSHPLYKGKIRAIDLYPYVDPVSGDKYLYFVRNMGRNGTNTERNGTSEIWGMKMKDWVTPDYSTVTRLTEVGKITPGGDKTRNQEDTINEGPAMLYKDGVYYLTYSINYASDKRYSVWQATSDSPLGTFKKIPLEKGGMILGVDGPWDFASGTGHHNFLTIGDELYIVYHAHGERKYTSLSDRAIAFDKLVWTKNQDGQTILHANGPTWSPQMLPTAISGMVNIAGDASVRAEGDLTGAEYLTDGIVNMHERGGRPEAEFTGTVQITLTWEDYRPLSALMIYNTTFYEKMFTSAKRIEFDCRGEDGTAETRFIDGASYDVERYVSGEKTMEFNRPGAAIVLRLKDDPEIKEIRITMSVPDGQSSAAVSEIMAISAQK